MVLSSSEIERKIKEIGLEVFPEFNGGNWTIHTRGYDWVYIFGGLGQKAFSGYSFAIHFKHGISYGGDVAVLREARGKNYGRRLVEAREKMCLASGASLIIINNNQNPSFWRYMDYLPLSKDLWGLFDRNIGMPCYNPLYKLLSES